MNLTITSFAGLGPLADSLRAEAASAPVLGSIGLFAVAAILLLIVLFALKWLIVETGRLLWSQRARRLKKARKPGYFMLVAPFAGPHSQKAQAFTEAALATHVTAFSFSTPHEVHATGRALSARDKIESARALMVTSEADLVLWGETLSGREQKGMRLEGLARQAGGSAMDARHFAFVLPGDMATNGADMSRLLAYIAVRQVQPALGRPEDFRSDKLEPIARRMGLLIEAYRGSRPLPALRQLQDDYASAALHIGESLPDKTWLEAACRAFEAILAGGRAGDADRWVNAKLGLGRGLLSLAEMRFDPVRVQEGTAHIRSALDVLRGHAKLRAADQGIAALRKAERMMENRRRFSITWPV